MVFTKYTNNVEVVQRAIIEQFLFLVPKGKPLVSLFIGGYPCIENNIFHIILDCAVGYRKIYLQDCPIGK